LRLRDFAFVAGENIHPEVVRHLRSAGHDVLDVKEAGLHGVDDLTLIRKSVGEKRVVLTHDSDFGTLAVAAGEPVLGIIYLRPGHINVEFTMGSLSTLLAQDLGLDPPFIIVAEHTPHKVRIRMRKI
jgi:predicted nuclease of predicted toxin-antitoxin system